MLRRGSLPRRVAAAAVAGALLATAGCGSSTDDQAPAAGPGEIVEVTVGVIPIVDVAPIYLGKEKGFFRERGIDLKMATADGGAAIVPGVLSGQFDFGFSNITSLLTAQTKNVPIQVIASGVASTGEKDLDFGGVVVKADSSIKTPADLAGKNVATNSLKNIGDVTTRESVRKANGDAGSVKFTQMPFPQMQGALQKGDIDAAFMVEPFLAQAKGNGARVVAWNFVDTAKELTVAGWFTSSKLMQEDPDLVARFTEAINESMQFANGQPGQVRTVLNSYMKIEQVVLDSMTLPNWPTKINRESVETLARLGKEDGLFGNAEPDLDKLLPKQ
jgi:NitT/TauT family transport system substrate-binding protein